MITFDRQAGPLQNFKPVTCHGHRKKCIVFRPRATPGWGRGAPQTPQNPPFFGVLRPQEDVFAKKKKFSVTKNFHHPRPTPHPHAPAQPSEHSPQSWCNNKYSQQFMCEIWTTTTNASNKYIKPAMSLYSLSINVHTISNPQYNDIICMLTNHFVWTMRWLRLRLRLHRLLECSRTIYNH